MKYQFTHEIPSQPATLRDRAERLLALSIALDAVDPLPPAGQPPFPRMPVSDANAQRFEKVADATRELYEAEFESFLSEAAQYRNDVEAWALEIGSVAKSKGGPISKSVPAQPAAQFVPTADTADD